MVPRHVFRIGNDGLWFMSVFDLKRATPEQREFYEELVQWIVNDPHPSVDLVTRGSIMLGDDFNAAIEMARTEAVKHKARMQAAGEINDIAESE